MTRPLEAKRDPSNGMDGSSRKAIARGIGRPGAFGVVAVLSITILCLAAYANSLQGPFVFDDTQNIEENWALRWTRLSWSGMINAVRYSPCPHRPVANVSFALNYYFGRYNVWGYHLVNVGIHLLNALLVYMLALATLARAGPPGDRRLHPSVSPWIALTAALIFVSHPIQTQAVTYIVQRMTSLCTLFYLAALLLYVHGRTAERPRRRWTLWAGSLVCWVLALGTKEIAATLPLTILLYEWYFFQDLNMQWIKKRAGFLLLAILLLGLVAWAYLGNAPLDRLLAGYAKRDFTPGQRLLTQPRVVMFYLSLLVFPLPSRLNLTHYVVPSQSLVEPITTLLSVMALAGLLGLAIYLARRQRLVSFCLLWFFLHLVIESSIVPLEMVFEHRLYLPMFGFSLMVAWLLFGLARLRSWWPIAVGGVTCLILAASTHQRNRVWQDSLTLWNDAVSKSPLHARAHNNLGIAIGKLGRFTAALTHLQEALRLNPDDAECHNNLGIVLKNMGRFDEAVAHYQKALQLRPDYAEAQINCGAALSALGRPQDAVMHYQEALRINPYFATAHLNWGVALGKMGRFDEAVAHLQEALQLRPDYAEAHNNLGILLARQGRLAAALRHFQHAVRLQPDYQHAHKNLQKIQALLQQHGRPNRP